MTPLGLGAIVETVGNIADDLFTSDEERLKLELETYKVDAGLLQGQHAVNAAEAAHESVFVAGWRPAIGWVGAAAMAYQFLLYPRAWPRRRCSTPMRCG
jgi:Holin of 3TMs, for gene-transfer release